MEMKNAIALDRLDSVGKQTKTEKLNELKIEHSERAEVMK